MDLVRYGIFYDEKCADETRISIPRYFSRRDLFVTGGSGFMGKVLLEKLLRSCPEIRKIFVLIRAKRGKTVTERMDAIKKLSLFDTIRETMPEQLDKLVPVNGDVLEIQLGLSQEDLKAMEDVSIVFHAAASVRFDDPLKYAILLNTRGTREVMRFAETLKHISVIMYISTTYCNLRSRVIEERVYEAPADWKEAIRLAENLDSEILNILAPKYMRFMPNTYTFTKALGEQIVAEYKNRLPVIIFRPSIVISSMKDPVPGWIDNFNGPVGLLIGCGVGITRSMYCNPNNVADFTPVDVAIKAIIIAAWKRGIDNSKCQDLVVYNCSTATVRFRTMQSIIEMAEKLIYEAPLERTIWLPGGSIATNRTVNFIKVMLFQIIPAIILDQFIKLSGNKPFLLSLQRKVFCAGRALEYFVLNRWTFKNENFLRLECELKQEDSKSFHFTDFMQFDIDLYFTNCILGAKRYLLNEDDKDLSRAHRHLDRMKKLNYAVKSLFWTILVYYGLIKYDLAHLYFDKLLNLLWDGQGNLA